MNVRLPPLHSKVCRPTRTSPRKLRSFFEQFWRSSLQVIYTILQLKRMEKTTGHGTNGLSVKKQRGNVSPLNVVPRNCGSYVCVVKKFVPVLRLRNELGTCTHVTRLMCPEHRYKHTPRCRIMKFVNQEMASVFRFSLLL